MAFDSINIGAAPNDNTGDPLRTGGQKINDNFAKAVEGPASATAAAVAAFDGTTGKLIQNGQSLAVTAGKFVPTANIVAGNGMYLPAANTLAFSTDGVERMLIDSSGNVGIGTTSPGAKLDVSGADALIHGVTVGRGAGNRDTNTVAGASALAANTTGIQNTAIGVNALLANDTGIQNTAVGLQALRDNTTGTNNTAVGLNALLDNITGIQNTAVGRGALLTSTTGNNNTAIGFDARASSATVSNTITLGNSSIAVLRCQQTTITALSDARDKTNITEIPAGLSFVEALRPVAFDWNMRDGGKVGIHEFGFIAQELQAAQVETGVTVPNLVYDDNPEKLEASSGVLIPVLVKAIQEQQVMISELKARLDAANL